MYSGDGQGSGPKRLPLESNGLSFVDIGRGDKLCHPIAITGGWEMQKVDGIGGVFFRGNDTGVLKEWYEKHLGIDISQGVWMASGGPTVFMPFQADTDYFGRDTQQWMINFRVSDMTAMIKQLVDAGIEVVTKSEWDSEIGRFARIHDPEGNPIELWEPATPAEN